MTAPIEVRRAVAQLLSAQQAVDAIAPGMRVELECEQIGSDMPGSPMPWRGWVRLNHRWVGASAAWPSPLAPSSEHQQHAGAYGPTMAAALAALLDKIGGAP